MSTKSLREIETAEFAALIKSERPVLVDFYATWCEPCRATEPVLERVASRSAGYADLVKVNVDNSPELAAEHGVRGVPTLMLFVRGQAVGRLVGVNNEKAVAALIEAHVTGLKAAGKPTAA